MRVKRKKRRRRKIKKRIFLKIFPIISTIFLIIIIILIYHISAIFKSPNSIKINVNEKYEDKIKVTSFFKDVTKKVKKDGDIDTSKLGTYTITYKYKTIFGYTKKKQVKIIVVDQEPPTIELTGGDSIEVFLNESYEEPGYTAKDNYDKEIEVTIEGEIDTSATGKYYIVYKAEDSSKNKTEVVRKITVEKISPLSMNVKDFNLDNYFEGTILKQTEEMPNEYLENMILAGDSVPWQFGLNYVMNPNQVWAKPCEGPYNFDSQKVVVNNQQTNQTLAELVKQNKPKYLTLHMGICDTNSGNIDTFIKSYSKVMDYIKENSPNTKLIVMSLMPQTEEYLSWIPLRNNEKINKYNYYLAELCHQKGVKFLNAATTVKDFSGKGDKTLFFDDGYHPNIKGMNKIKKYMNNHGYKEKE